MRLQTRAVLVVIAVVVITVGVAAVGLTWRATDAALDRARLDSAHEAMSTAGASAFALREGDENAALIADAVAEDDDITTARFLTEQGTALSEPVDADGLADLPDQAVTSELVQQARAEGIAVQRRGQSLDVVVRLSQTTGQASYLQLVFDLDEVEAARRQTISAAMGLTLAVLAVGIAMAVVATRQITRPVQDIINSAAALERGDLDPAVLDAQAARTDELGTLASQFQAMAVEVIEREHRLSAQVAALQVQIDEQRRSSDVASITEAPTFKDLEARGRQMRERRQARARTQTATDHEEHRP